MALSSFKAISVEHKDFLSLMNEVCGVMREHVADSSTSGLSAKEALIKANSAWELVSKDFSVLATKWNKMVKKMINVSHRNIYLIYIPRILSDTACTDRCMLINAATMEKKPVGLLPMNKMFILKTGWPRSLRVKDILAHKGLFLTHSFIAPTLPPDCSVGRWIPFWEEDFGLPMVYQKDVTADMAIRNEESVRDAISNDVAASLMNSLLERTMNAQRRAIDVGLVSSGEEQMMPDFTTETVKVTKDRIDAANTDNTFGKVISGDGRYEDLSTASKGRGQNTPTP
uniref:Movement protein n=1 Tax=Citrus leaf rugose virus TaxID=37126 RepID=J9S7D9_9BROM|nr:movement protein [Citrus leaf rugose virus]